MLLCQITDLHIKADRRLAYGVVDTATMLERCVQRILDLPQTPDAVIATGDLVDLGRPEEYGLLRELLAPLRARMPLFPLMGNHDDRQALRDAFGTDASSFGEATDAPFLQYVVDEFALRIVALDTVIPGRGDGELCSRRLGWLDGVLAEGADRPTLVALHHPPFDCGIGHMDRIGLRGRDALESILRRHPQVQRVTAGHLHRDMSVRFGGTVAGTCPSTAHQVALDLTPGAADRFVLEPPGFQLHHWDGRRLVTHSVPVEGGAGPYPFRIDGRLID